MKKTPKFPEHVESDSENDTQEEEPEVKKSLKSLELVETGPEDSNVENSLKAIEEQQEPIKKHQATLIPTI